MHLDLSKLIPMGGLMAGVWLAGVVLGYIDAIGLGSLSVAFFAVALIAFLGMLRAGADMRTAITSGFVVMYFSLFSALSTSETNRAQFDTQVGQELWDNFTYLIGVIVLFYFGATAAIEITKHVKNPAGEVEAQGPQALDAAADPSTAGTTVPTNTPS